MFKYRRAFITDVDAIIKVMQNTNYAQYVYPGKSSSELRKIIARSISSRIYIVCLDSGSKRIVGYFIIDSLNTHLSDIPKKIRLDKRFAYHAGVGVHSDFRGKGIAYKLTKFAFKVAKIEGYCGMYADVGSNNNASIKLQKKCGFKELVRYASKYRPSGIENVVYRITF